MLTYKRAAMRAAHTLSHSDELYRLNCDMRPVLSAPQTYHRCARRSSGLLDRVPPPPLHEERLHRPTHATPLQSRADTAKFCRSARTVPAKHDNPAAVRVSRYPAPRACS